MKPAAGSARFPSSVIAPRAECDGGLVLLVLFVFKQEQLGCFIVFFNFMKDETSNETLTNRRRGSKSFSFNVKIIGNSQLFCKSTPCLD